MAIAVDYMAVRHPCAPAGLRSPGRAAAVSPLWAVVLGSLVLRWFLDVQGGGFSSPSARGGTPPPGSSHCWASTCRWPCWCFCSLQVVTAPDPEAQGQPGPGGSHTESVSHGAGEPGRLRGLLPALPRGADVRVALGLGPVPLRRPSRSPADSQTPTATAWAYLLLLHIARSSRRRLCQPCPAEPRPTKSKDSLTLTLTLGDQAMGSPAEGPVTRDQPHSLPELAVGRGLWTLRAHGLGQPGHGAWGGTAPGQGQDEDRRTGA